MSGKSKSKAYTPEMTAIAAQVAAAFSIPDSEARKALGSLQLSKFKQFTDRGIVPTGDYKDDKLKCKAQDAEIQRQHELNEQQANRTHKDDMALADIEIQSGYSDDKRLLLGVKSADELRTDKQEQEELKEQRKLKAALEKQVEELKKQRAELSGEIASATSGKSNGKGQQQTMGSVVPS
jgi:hypothetical protein